MWDEERPRPKADHAFTPRDLTPLSKAELQTYQQFCQDEIIRTAAELEKRTDAENTAAGLFKK